MSFVKKLTILASKKFVESLMVTATIAVAFGTLLTFVNSADKVRGDLRLSLSQADNAHAELSIAILEKEVAALQKAMEEGGKKTLDNAAVATKLAQVDEIRRQLDELKGIIVQDPTKALALPLVRKDISDLIKRQDALSASVDVQIGRIYDFSKWFLALMITLAIGLVTMGFYRPKAQP